MLLKFLNIRTIRLMFYTMSNSVWSEMVKGIIYYRMRLPLEKSTNMLHQSGASNKVITSRLFD